MKPVVSSLRYFAGKGVVPVWSVAICAAAAGLLLLFVRPSKLASSPHPTSICRVSPLRLWDNERIEVDLSPDRVHAALARVAQHDYLRWNQLTHGLRLWGPDADGPGKWTGKSMLDVIDSAEESQRAFGFAPHLLNRNGLHFGHRIVEEKPQGEKHLDETVATLGEIGIPSDRPIRVWDQTATVADGVRAAMSNFSLDQELDFTPVVFALYLPPQRTWTNKFGETFSFDAMCQRMCERPLGEGNCGGCHRMYSLAMVLAADRQHEILSGVSRRNVRSKLLQALDALRRSQRADGSWDALWFDPAKAAPEKDLEGKIMATGHTLEWMAIAPRDIIDDPKMVSRACEALLKLVLAAPRESLRDDYNYYTHAASALKLWSPRARAGGDDRTVASGTSAER